MSDSADRPPLLLFDGVCNLCHGAVQWVLKRDRKQCFRFASLQSQAGREALSRVGHQGAAPDNLVLIQDGRALHQSDAALGIARLLGFPWALLAVFAVIPRPIRDAVYRWIARNRYRWFGKKEACPMPTPETMSRFLDANEPPPESWEIQQPTPAAETALAKRGLNLSSFFGRIGLLYVALYVFPFPFNLLSGTSELIGDWTSAHREILRGFADFFFGIELTVFERGSGDTTSNYIEIVMRLSMALAGALLWHGLTRCRAMHATTIESFFLVLRYYLVSTLMVYGWIKFFPTQMPPPGPDRLLQTYGDSSPMGIAWTFIGASPAYQVFSGAAELLAGFLLMFRRTVLLGALISFAVMVNVAALNYFYDVPVKLFSSHLVLFSLLLIAPDLPRLAGLFFFHLPTQPRMLQVSKPLKGVAIVFFLMIAWKSVYDGAKSAWGNMHTYGAAATAGPLQGFYLVESMQRDDVNDREIDDAKRWVRVGINHSWGNAGTVSMTIVYANGTSTRFFATLDFEADTLKFSSPAQGLETFVVTTGFPQQDEEGEWEGEPPAEVVLQVEGESTSALIRLVRDTEYTPELTSRGFHWINEYPRNR